MAEQQKQAQEQDINQLLKVRREKLQALQESGKDPFEITKYDVTHHSMEIKDQFEALEGKRSFRCRPRDAEACYGESFFLQRSGSSGYHTVLRGERQHRRRLL